MGALVLVTGLATTLVTGLLASTTAQADTSPPAGTPTTVAADRLPTWQINGVVWDQEVVGTTVFVGGKFTRARPPGVSAGGAGEVGAQNFLAYDVTTGNRIASIAHSVNGQILSVTASPDRSVVYIGGDFTSVDGQARGHVAAFNASTGALLSGFHPSVNGQVSDIATTGSTVYVGGSFSSAGGSSRTRLAAFSASNGSLLPWAPRADDYKVQAMVMSPDASKVIVGGSFTTLNGVLARGMGALHATTGATLPWAANTKITNGGKDCGITSLSADANQVYGSGFAFGCGNFEGTFAANPSTGAIVLVNDCHGDTYDTFPIGQVLYSVSHAHDCRPIHAFPESKPRAANMRHAIAFTTYPTGTNSGPDSYGWNYNGVPDSTMLQWYPELTNGSFTGQTQAAWSVTGNDDYVVLGGEFPKVNGTNQQGLVRFARRALAPNKRGPVRTATAPAPTAAMQGASTARITWQAAYDMDNAGLTYDVYRSGRADPVATTTASSNFWTTPTLSAQDQGVPGGTYSYTVRVRDPLGNTLTLPATNSVTSTGGGNTPPDASFSTSSTALLARFDASASSDPGGSIVGYAWSFGDGSPTGTGRNVDHLYAAPGTYPVTLTVTDNNGATDSLTRDVTVPAGTGPTTVAADAFGRTLTSGWGSADQGGAWTLTGAATSYSVGGGVGTFAMPTAGAGPSAMLNGVSSSNADTVVTFSPQKAATGGTYVTTVGRAVGTASYRATVGLKSNGTATINISRVVGSTTTAVVTSRTIPGFTFAAGDQLRLRFQAVGTSPTTLNARVWRAGQPEPGTWQASGSDSVASLQAAGSVGLMGYLSATSTNAPSPVSFDDLTVTEDN